MKSSLIIAVLFVAFGSSALAKQTVAKNEGIRCAADSADHALVSQASQASGSSKDAKVAK